MMNTTMSRRKAIARLAALGLTLPLLDAGRAKATIDATPQAAPRELTIRGIDYDVGTRQTAEFTSRMELPEAFMSKEIEAIRDQLHCNSISIFSSDPDRIEQTATLAADSGLQVWIQSRLVDTGVDETLATLETVATTAETFRSQGHDIVLDVGCEFTFFTDGIIPGESFAERIDTLLADPGKLPEYNAKLDEMVQEALTRARSHYSGPITYSSGSWESVDWSGFDYLGVDFYRDETNAANYAETVRAYHEHGKPIVIREFGCCAYQGAEDQGAMGNTIVDWSKNPPELIDDFVRDEQVQATYITELLDIFEQEQIDGAFVYQFIEPDLPHTADPKFDLDLAAFAITKVQPPDTENAYATSGFWEPKVAFEALAGRFGEN